MQSSRLRNTGSALTRIGNLALFAFALILPLSSFGAGQTPSAPTLQVYSRETIVDVLVTDSKNQPVRDLKGSDFSIKEDGRPVPLRSFGEFERGLAGSGGAHTVLSPEIYTNYQAAPTRGPVNVVLIDALHLSYVAANRALEAISGYAGRMPTGTQVAIFWLSASGLHLLQGFTSDPALLQRAVLHERTDIGSNGDCYAIDRLTIDALNQVAAYVAGIKGRKNLIWFAPGIPVYLVRDGGYGWGTTTSCRTVSPPRAFGANRTDGIALFGGADGSEGIDMSMVHHLMDTYEIFSNEQIAVSPLNPAGVVGLGLSNLIAEEVAAQSGGVAISNNNDLTGAMAQIIDQSSHYYTLSYVPPRSKNDGHYHTITIQMSQPGLHLVYRKGYNAEDPRQPKQFTGPDLIKAALQGKTPAATQLLFDAKLVPADPLHLPAPINPPAPARSKGRSIAQRTPYDLLLAVPQNQIAFGAGPDGTHTVSLEFAFDAYGLNGKFLGSHSQNVTLNLTSERYQRFIQAPVIFHEQIAFLPGPLFLRVGILDATSNKVGTLEIP
jgi:VWFA-related protein